MKKLIIFILMFFTIPTISVFAVTETITYDVTVYDDKGYDLLTGKFIDMPSYATTNRLLVNSESIDFSSDTFHHVLYWDQNNNYIGYSNSQYSNLQLSTYIPAAINNYITMPLNTKFVAFMVSSGVEVPIPALNDQTLEEVFGQGNLLDSEQLVTNGDFSDGTTGWLSFAASMSVISNNAIMTGLGNSNKMSLRTSSSMNVNIGIKMYQATRLRTLSTGTLSLWPQGFGGYNAIIQNNPVQNQWYFLSKMFTGNADTEANAYRIIEIDQTYIDSATQLNKQMEVDYSYTFNISSLIANKQYSPLYSTTFDLMSDAQIKAQMDLWVQNPQYWLDYDALGFELIQSQLEIYYNLYVTTLANYPYALSASSLELMTISYDRDEVTPLPIEDIDVKIENYLTDLNVNTPFAKTLLAISMIIIAVVALALLKTPKYVYIGAGVLVYLFFTLLGWFPVWILVMLGILVIGILIISFKGNGGGSSD